MGPSMTTAADLDRLESIYRSEVRRVYGFARNRVGEHEAADLTAEVFHAAALAFRDGRGEVVTPAWLMAVTKNKVNDAWRRAYRRKAKQHLTRPRGEDVMEFPTGWAEDPRRPAVLAALDELPAKDRALLVLHHVDGMSVAELASDMNKTVSAVESALARARRRFRRHYDREDDRDR